MAKKYFSTGEFASLCSVTPDAVLKWIKIGKIQAVRTPGGHYRIPRDLIQSKFIDESVIKETKYPSNKFQFCWEFNSQSGNPLIDCRQCLVYRSKAQKCYELSHLSLSAGHKKVFCTSSCNNCDYYHYIQTLEPF